MQVGVLTPFMVEVGLNGDTFDIDLTAMVRTLPTINPLFGSFKLQMDVFEIPMRLYNGILHNNALKIGNNMQKVKFPKLKFDVKIGRTMNTDRPFTLSQIGGDSLMAYLGLRGFGTLDEDIDTKEVTRYINAVPALAYYDVVKNYYSNKQEEMGYMIGATPNNDNITLVNIWEFATGNTLIIDPNTTAYTLHQNDLMIIEGNNLDINRIGIDGTAIEDLSNNAEYTPNGSVKFSCNLLTINRAVPAGTTLNEASANENASIDIIPFPIENIDKMRVDILKATGLDEATIYGANW